MTEHLSCSTSRGGSADSVEFALDPGETLVLRTDGSSGPAVSGYARIRAGSPVGATAEFVVLDEERGIVTEVGISSVEPVLRSIGGTTSNFAASLDSAIALVNPSPGEHPAEVRIRALGAGFDEVAMVYLAEGQHMARFMRQLLPMLPEDFDGTVSISAGVPIAATSLRTRNGLPLSSLQLDSLEYSNTPCSRTWGRSFTRSFILRF